MTFNFPPKSNKFEIQIQEGEIYDGGLQSRSSLVANGRRRLRLGSYSAGSRSRLAVAVFSFCLPLPPPPLQQLHSAEPPCPGGAAARLGGPPGTPRWRRGMQLGSGHWQRLETGGGRGLGAVQPHSPHPHCRRHRRRRR